jgi:hypothetical protein
VFHTSLNRHSQLSKVTGRDFAIGKWLGGCNFGTVSY